MLIVYNGAETAVRRIRSHTHSQKYSTLTPGVIVLQGEHERSNGHSLSALDRGITSHYAVNIDFHHSETSLAQNDSAAGTSRQDDRGMLIFVMRSSRRRESLEPGGHQGGI